MKGRRNMKLDKNFLKLYAVTNFDTFDDSILISKKITNAIDGGVTCIQLREKNCDYQKFLERSILIGNICKKRKIPFIVNDNVEISIKSDADGVHVGQEDLDASESRNRIGKDKILGVSVKTVDQALKAQKDGADYLGVGSMFESTTKQDTMVSFVTLKEICKSVSIPVVAIGGINILNIEKLKGTGIIGIAASSCIFSGNNTRSDVKNILEHLKNIF